MTGVYSGGLAYEYTMEENKYGIVQVDGDKVTELPDFEVLRAAFAATASPSGDGGYNKNGGKANDCPPQSTNWNVTGDELPAMPEAAKIYLTQGAGKGVGLTGTGSQNGQGKSAGLAKPGSGVVATPVSGGAGATSTPKSAASTIAQGRVAPYIVSALVVSFTALGAFML